MTADGKTKVWGIIADPVAHSMSPALHNFYAERTGVNGVYVPFLVKEEEVETALKGAHSLHIMGLSVTIPHKQTVIRYLTEIDGHAKAVGAVNTLVYTKDGYKGYNTDVPGLLRSINEAGFSIRDRECILIGAGGAAKAAASLLLDEGASCIYLLNRSEERAQALAAELNGRDRAADVGGRDRAADVGGRDRTADVNGRDRAADVGDRNQTADVGGRDQTPDLDGEPGSRQQSRLKVIPMALSDYGRIPRGEYLAIQSTSVGMEPDIDAVPIEDPAFYENISQAVDVIYTPVETEFMRRVKKAGGTVVNGLDMLIYQGVLSFELWNPGVTVDQETIKEARTRIRNLLAERKKERTAAKSLILIGFMGAGKTSVGSAYAKKHGIPTIDIDQWIEQKTGISVSSIFETQGEEAFRKLETQALKDLLKESGPMVLSAGGGLPIREVNRELIRQLGTVVYLKASPATVLKRLSGDRTRPLLQGSDPGQKAERLMAMREPIYQSAARYTLTVDGKTVDEIVEEIEEVL